MVAKYIYAVYRYVYIVFVLLQLWPSSCENDSSDVYIYRCRRHMVVFDGLWKAMLRQTDQEKDTLLFRSEKSNPEAFAK